MTINLSKDYAVYTAERQTLFTGSYQECLEFVENEEDTQVFVDVDKTSEEYELEDIDINYTFED